jgi:hypothetical protein
MTNFDRSESLHRLVKQALDSGAAESLEQAEAMFRGYRLVVAVGAAEGADVQHQTALLTAVALGRRVFLGGVQVQGDVDVPLVTPLPFGRTVREAVTQLGGEIGGDWSGSPRIYIGGGPRARCDGFQVRTAASGWRGGIVPAHAALTPAEGPSMPLAAMLAAALAINEAFLFVNGGVPAAGRRAVGLSLWRPQATANWLEADPGEPRLTYLPSRLWLIGLGHLGQAYLWGLGMLPYADPASVTLFLQDVDVITPSTESTSVLSDAATVGLKKTRAMATWAEGRGFSTAVVERFFDAGFDRRPDEPAIALCGLDNAVGRQALDQVGFDLIVEAGLGRGYRDFRTMRLHVLPGPKSASEIWRQASAGESVETQAAYRRMLSEGELDRCGVTLLAGKAVGAPFVGAVAATLALAEVLRLLHGGPLHGLIDLDLQSVDHRVATRHQVDFSQFNPGYSLAAG